MGQKAGSCYPLYLLFFYLGKSKNHNHTKCFN